MHQIHTMQSSYEMKERLSSLTKVAIISTIAFIAMLMPDLAMASNGGLTTATNNFNRFLQAIQPLIRVGAIIAVIAVGVGYMAGAVDKGMAVKIVIGLVIIASAAEIVRFFYAANIS